MSFDDRSGHPEQRRGVSHARFFAPTAGSPGDLVSLPDDEAEHLTRVLRLAAGDPVRVFNGRGGEFESVVETAGKQGVRVRVGPIRDAAPEPALAVTLVQAILKGDKMDDVVRDAVMIGVASIQPVVTSRSEVSLAALARGRRRARWERIAVAAAKQCGRAVIPSILEPGAFDDDANLRLPRPVLMLVEPGAPAGVALHTLTLPVSSQVTLMVGPEGGWAPDEMSRVPPDVCRITLGGRTLRADAMALVAVSAIFTKWAEF